MNVLKINGQHLHYTDQGDPAGVPLVFANSLGTDLRVWSPLLPHLPPGLRIIRYDMRGHGLSDAPQAAYFMGDLVADAAGLIDALGLRNIVFVGLSIGGVVAQGLAAERPELLRAAVLCSTAAKIGTAATWSERIAAIEQGGIEAIAESVLERWFSKTFHATRAPELALWRHMLTRTPRAGYIGCCHALAETDLRASTARLRLPALAIAGSADGATPPDLLRETADSIENARFALIRGAGHIPCAERPADLARHVTAFLEELGLVRAA